MRGSAASRLQLLQAPPPKDAGGRSEHAGSRVMEGLEFSPSDGNRRTDGQVDGQTGRNVDRQTAELVPFS